MELVPDFATRVISFADFQLDLRAGELRRNGGKVKLQNQPFQVLAMLLEHPGEVVTREEMRTRLWPAETFVDFDHGLNSAVRRLRDALGDSAENPVFVETLGRRGYRFIFPVERNGGSNRNGDSHFAVAAPSVIPISAVESPGVRLKTPAKQSASSHRRWIVLRAGLLLLSTALVSLSISGNRFRQLLHRVLPDDSGAKAATVIERQLTANPADTPVAAAVISPDGKFLAYSDKTGLYLRQISTGETHPVPLPAGFVALVQDWFPDSAHLVVSRSQKNGTSPSLWVISILGGPPRQLAVEGSDARVSPDGTTIVYLHWAIGRNEVWLMRADGAGQRRIFSDSTADQVYFSSAAWAPEGRHIAFIRTVVTVYNAADPTGVKKSIEILDLASDHTEVVLTSQEIGSALGWTPNGSLIYSLRETNPDQSDFGLWRMPIDPHSARPRGAPVKLSSGHGWAAELSVASNGKSLALRRVEPNADTYIAEVDSNTKQLSPKRLTLDERADYVFGWTSDSNSVLFLSNRDGPLHLYRQAIDETQPELLVGGDDILAIPRMAPSGTDVSYLQMPKQRRASDRVKIMRVPLAGGVTQSILEAPGIWNHQCARPPATLCIYSPTDANVQRFFAFDPNTGTSHEITLARVDADPERPNWSLSPDGSHLAMRVLRSDGDAAVRVLSLSDGPQTTIPLTGWPRMAGLDWAADGKSLWIAASSSRTGPLNCALLNVSTAGAIHVMYQDEGMCFLAAIPSPDGRLLALEGVRPDSSNVWLLENF